MKIRGDNSAENRACNQKNGVALNILFSRAACEHEKKYSVTGPQSFISGNSASNTA